MRSAHHPHERVQLAPGPGRTKQAFASETDINNIMRKYEKGEVIDHFNKYQGRYGDFINSPDYHTAMVRIAEANEAFQSIPARIRAKFGNDPAAFLEFAQDPENAEKMVEMGLAVAAPREPKATDTPAEPEPGELLKVMEATPPQPPPAPS